MSSISPFRRRALTAALALPVVAFAACRQGSDQRSPATERTAESAGEVTKEWNPQAVSTIGNVSAEALRSAIAQRLDGARPGGITDDHWKHVRGLYGHYAQSPLWIDGHGLIATRVQALTRAMADADSSDALDLSEYPLGDLTTAIQAARAAGDGATPQQLAEVDVLLSASYAALGEDLLAGQLSPKAMKQDWHIDPRDKSIDSALVRGLVTDALDSSLASMRPQDPGYDGLRTELAHYRQLAARGGWGTVPAGRALKPGQPDTPERLEALRTRLRAEGSELGGPPEQEGADSTRGGPPAAASSVYDRGLAGAVARFQAAHAINVDSILGAETVDAMNKPVTYRLAQIAANMERYRWMPRTLGARYVYVNVPAFRLQAYDSGQKTLEMKVVVGQNYQDKTTPVFADSMETVVFRPYWYVTDDIADQETWPKINADPNYMAANDLETYKEDGKTHIRQKPGDKNSLGLVKFLFPNAYNIYLHDTPAKDLFNKDVRAFSHGCIRVEKPAELAQWVLGWPADRVDQAMHAGADNQSVKVSRKIPVYITYFTTFVEDGHLRFGNDLYDRDDALVAAAAKAAEPDSAVAAAAATLRRLSS